MKKTFSGYEYSAGIVESHLIGIYLSVQKGEPKNAVTTAELIADYGINGDQHAGKKPQRQISLFANETLLEINHAGIDVSAEELSANLLTTGIALDTLPIETRIKIGLTTIEISESRKPCGALTKIDKRLPKAAYLRCGKFARVIIGGLIRLGDPIEILTLPAKHAKLS